MFEMKHSAIDLNLIVRALETMSERSMDLKARLIAEANGPKPEPATSGRKKK